MAKDLRKEWDERPNVGKRPVLLTAGDEKELGEWMLKVLAAEGGEHDIVFDEGDFYEYLPWDGVWRAIPTHDLGNIIQSFSGSLVPIPKRPPVPLKISAAMVKGAIELASYRAMAPGCFSSAPGGIAFANGFVPITSEGVGALEPLSPEHRTRAIYEFAYDPKATCSTFLGFLDDLFRDDEDKPKKIACLQEFFGAARAGVSTRYQKCLFLRSHGGGGRSSLMKVIEAAFSSDSIAGIKPQQFPDANRRAMIAGKLLNYADELPSASILESDWFKQIVTGDWTDACLKYKNPIRFRPIAGHCFLANDLPQTTDITDAFFRRIIVLAFNRKFHEEKTRDLAVADKILETDLPGIVVWLLQGIDRLVKQKHYTIPPSHNVEAQGWRVKSDSVALFLEEKCVHSNAVVPGTGRDWLTSKQLYIFYREWAEVSGHRYPVAQNVFGTRLKALQLHMRKTSKGNYYPARLRQRADSEKPDLLTDLARRPRIAAVEEVDEAVDAEVED